MWLSQASTGDMPGILPYPHKVCPSGSCLLDFKVSQTKFLYPSSSFLFGKSWLGMWVLEPCNLWAWCLMIAAVYLQRWRGRHAQRSGHLCKHLSRCLHGPESASALAMAPAHLDYSCTVVTSLSYPGILKGGNNIFLYIFHFQMVADNIFGTKLLYLGLRGLEQVFELSTLGTRRKSASTGWNFLIFSFTMMLSFNAWWISLLCFTVWWLWNGKCWEARGCVAKAAS